LGPESTQQSALSIRPGNDGVDPDDLILSDVPNAI
jgi:hypothetical protein